MAYGNDDRYRGDYGRGDYRSDYGRNRDRYQDDRSQGDRGFADRAGDEVRSWFGDQDAERRREQDARRGGYSGSSYGDYGRNYDDDRSSRYARSGYDYDSNYARGNDRDRGESLTDKGRDAWRDTKNEVRGWFGGDDDDRGARGRYDYDDRNDSTRSYARGAAAGAAAYGASRFGQQNQRNTDEHGYGNWRQRQIESLDRDYEEYRREHQSQFDSHFSNWRGQRQTQRGYLNQIQEHAEVVGSDGEHVGTVDHVRGDRILLTKTDKDAGGHHHSIPSSWFQSVDDGKVTITKTADEAKRAWRDEENNQAMFGGDQRDNNRDRALNEQGDASNDGAHMLNRSFSGTY